MCLNLRRMRNKSLSYGYDNFQAYSIQFPCGTCAECKELARSQWYLRNYWQCKYVFDHVKGNNFILFDTLTYRDADLPHLSDHLPSLKNSILDYPCFSFEDIRNFMKRLRINLTRKGMDVKKNLTYFICSEYGTDDNYTHRPHYHVLFYVTECNLTPIEFSLEVDRAWQKGRTDGVTYKGADYVMAKNVFGTSYTKNTDENLRRVSLYVAKYVTKDSSFQNTIDNRIELAVHRLLETDMNWSSDDDKSNFQAKDAYIEVYRQVRRLCSQFHRQSQGFGMYALLNYEIDDLVKTGIMQIPDKDKIVKEIPIPMYYSRKLFCKQVSDENGRRFWIPSELGKEYRQIRTYTNISKTARRFENWYLNLTDEDKTFVDDIMEGRNFSDLATYLVCYRGRIVARNYRLSQEFPEVEVVILSNNEFDPVSDHNKYFAVEDGITYNVHGRTEFVNFKNFEDHYIIDQYFGDCRYQGFDELLAFYEDNIKPKNQRLQEAFEEKENLRKIYKYMNIKCKK